MQQKTEDTTDNARLIGMETNMPKTKYIWMNCTSSAPIRLHGADIKTLTSSRNLVPTDPVTTKSRPGYLKLVRVLACSIEHGEVKE